MAADTLGLDGLDTLTEAEFVDRLLAAAAALDLLYFHAPDGRRVLGPAGFPDLTIVGHGILYREVKTATGPVSVHQLRWGRAIRAAGGNWSVWRPADIATGRVQRELRQLAECPLSAG